MKTIPAPLATLPPGISDVAKQIAADRDKLAAMARFLDSPTGVLIDKLASWDRHSGDDARRLIREIHFDVSRDSLFLLPSGSLGDGIAFDLLDKLEHALGKEAVRVATENPGEYNWAFEIGDSDASGQFMLVIEVREIRFDRNLETNPRYMP